jgi:hypothetical protein
MKPDQFAWLDDPSKPRPPQMMVLEGDALGHLIDYARKWKPENDRIRAARIATARGWN